MSQKSTKTALFLYYFIAAFLWTYLITTSLCYSYEHFIGEIPAGMPWIFGFIGMVFAIKFFCKKMQRFSVRADNFLFVRGKDILAVSVILLFAIAIFATLAWGWLKLYPYLF